VDLPPVPLARPGRRVAAVVVALLLVWFVYIVFNNPNFQWKIVGKYLFSKEILDGVKLTIELTVSAMAIGVTLGVIAALMRLSDNMLLSRASTIYIAAFRGTPALVQLIFWYNLAALFPKITLGIPFFGPDFVSLNANTIITPVVAANLGLGLCEGAYMAEIVRAGIMSVDPGQREAGVALGLTRAQTMRRIILPQALRVIVPPTGNQIIGMLKLSSLASVISVTELLAQDALVWYAQGPIVDRTKELLGRTDFPIVLLRRQLDEQIRLVEEGKEPMNFFRESADIIHGTGEAPDWSKPELLLWHNFRKLYHKGFANDDVDRYGPAIELVKDLHRRIELADIGRKERGQAGL